MSPSRQNAARLSSTDESVSGKLAISPRSSPASASSLVTTAPPYRLLTFFAMPKLKMPAVPNEPRRLPLTRAPNDCDVSSISGTPRSRQIFATPSTSQASPCRCVTITAPVSASISCSTSRVSMLQVLRSMSANTGVAPAQITILITSWIVYGERITFFFVRVRARSVRKMPTRACGIAMAWRTPIIVAISRSSTATSSPESIRRSSASLATFV